MSQQGSRRSYSRRVHRTLGAIRITSRFQMPLLLGAGGRCCCAAAVDYGAVVRVTAVAAAVESLLYSANSVGGGAEM